MRTETRDGGRKSRKAAAVKEKRKVAVFAASEVKKSNARMKSPSKDRIQTSRKRSRSPSRVRDVVKGGPSSQPLQRALKGVAERRRKARQRQERHVKRLRAVHGEKSLLELASVRSSTREEYLRRLRGFYNFVGLHNLPLRSEADLDLALLDFSDEMYLNGEDSHAGEKLKAALEFERPEAARNGQLNLPRFKRALKGWRKLAPTQVRMPLLEFLKSSISGVLMKMGEKEMALFNETSFSTYARPGELLAIYPADVVPSNSSFSHDVIVLAPMERGETSKAGVFDETLVLDDVRMPCLGKLLVELSQKQIKKKGEDQPLWDFNASQFLRRWRKAVQILEVEDAAHSPYQNRHGGASRDCLLKLRSVPSISRRGRWASDASARIYSKPGRLQQIVNQYGRRLEAFGEDVRKNFEAYYRSGSLQMPRGVVSKMKELA